MSLSVKTELPPRRDWTRTVNFSIAQSDVLFKKLLIYLSVTCIKTFPYNDFVSGIYIFIKGCRGTGFTFAILKIREI